MKRLAILLILLIPGLGAAAPEGVVRMHSTEAMDAVYDRVYQALEEKKFWVVFEADMGKRMAKNAELWGDAYNENQLGAVKSMVFCNIWWTNRIANADPDLLALCPLHLSLFEQNGETILVMPRLSVLAKGSEGQARAAELEAELTAILETALQGQ